MRFATLSLFALSLVAVPVVAHASSINPLSDGFNLSVGNTVLSNTNASYNGLTGVLTFNDGTATYTFAEANASPLTNALSVTRTCVTLNLSGCSSATVSVSNASVLNGALQANALVGATLQASATAGVSNLVFANSTAAIGAQTALVGYNANAGATNSPVPEPGTITMVLSGVLGVAGAARRRFLKA